MSWPVAFVAGSVATVAALVAAAWVGCWALAESEARMSDESAEYLHGAPHVGRI